MAKISTRKETGTLLFDFNYLGTRCREQTTLKNTKANRRKMEKVLEKIERAIVDGSFDYGSFFPGSAKAIQFATLRPTNSNPKEIVTEVASSHQKDTPVFSSFAETWFSENEVVWRINTQKMHRSHLRKHILPAFGEMHLHMITKADVLKFRAELGKVETRSKSGRLSPKTINEIVSSVCTILSEAADRYEIADVSQGIKRLKQPKNHIDPLSLEEVQRFLKIVRADYKHYFTVRFFTGMRTGEVHGLKWKCVDFERKEILVRETYGAGRTEYTKNDGSQREIKMSEHVLKALEAQYKATAPLSEYVFCTNLGTPVDPMNVNSRIWKPTLRLLGLAERRLYQTRHTSATFWLAAGESPEWIAMQMGHTSTEMLFKVYSRYIPNLTRQDGSAFDKLIKTRFAS
jgi:integrase